MGSRVAVFRTASADRDARRLLGSNLAFALTEHSTWVAITVFAFERGGVREAGAAAVAQLVPAAILAPVAGAITDRNGRARSLAAGSTLLALALAATAAAMLGDAPAIVVYTGGVIVSVLLTFGRPAFSSLAPTICRRPDVLVALNVMLGLLENVGLLIGPLLAGVVLVAAEPGVVFVIAAGLMFTSATAALGIRVESSTDDGLSMSPHDTPLAEFTMGVQVLREERSPRLILALLSSLVVLDGMLDIAFAVIAVDILDRGPGTVGVLAASVGVGSMVGAGISAGLVERRRLSTPLLVGVVVAGLAIGGAGLSRSYVVTLALLAVSGVGSAVVELAGRSLLQGLTPDDTLARVFAIAESLTMAALAVGGGVYTVVATALGPDTALLIGGLAVVGVAGVLARSVIATDRNRPVVDRQRLDRVRAVHHLALLPAHSLEQLAANSLIQHFSAGQPIVTIGDPGRDFFVIDDGSVEVVRSDDTTVLLSEGESFGEIALLRNIPRTATVRAGPAGVTTLAIDGSAFLSAVTGRIRSLSEAERTSERLLADDRQRQIDPDC